MRVVRLVVVGLRDGFAAVLCGAVSIVSYVPTCARLGFTDYLAHGCILPCKGFKGQSIGLMVVRGCSCALCICVYARWWALHCVLLCCLVKLDRYMVCVLQSAWCPSTSLFCATLLSVGQLKLTHASLRGVHPQLVVVRPMGRAMQGCMSLHTHSLHIPTCGCEHMSHPQGLLGMFHMPFVS